MFIFWLTRVYILLGVRKENKKLCQSQNTYFGVKLDKMTKRNKFQGELRLYTSYSL